MIKQVLQPSFPNQHWSMGSLFIDQSSLNIDQELSMDWYSRCKINFFLAYILKLKALSNIKDVGEKINIP